MTATPISTAFVGACVLLMLAIPSDGFTVAYIPLDERFTTRFAFLNLAQVTPFTVLTPPMSIISSLRTPAPLPLLDQWMDEYFPQADAAVISLELYVYGGLITSRISNDSTTVVAARMQQLTNLCAKYPHVQVHLGTVIMRIPSYSYSPPLEEPWYWAFYGADLFTYSYYLDAYNQTNNITDYNIAMAAEAAVPPDIVAEFVWRRQRNFNVTWQLLQTLENSTLAGRPLAATLYITQDDNAQYGFNIEEAARIKAFVASQPSLQSIVKVYPGADEVGLSMLAKLTVSTMTAIQDARDTDLFEDIQLPNLAAPGLTLVFRDPSNSSLYLIPNYEGQPMIYTLLDQIAAAGGVPIPNNWTAAAIASYGESRGHSFPRYFSTPLPNVTLLVNNFNDTPQIEAPNQPSGRSINDYSMFTPWACGGSSQQTSVLSFVDNRYSNGADTVLVQYMMSLASMSACASPNATNTPRGLSLDRVAFAGWNTDGNTLGDSISNAIVLHYFATFGPFAAHQPAIHLALDRLARYRRDLYHGPWNASKDALKSDPVAPCSGSCANTYRTVLRIVEDSDWQAILRQTEELYINQVDGETYYTLGNDLDFYERYAFKILGSRVADLSAAFALPWTMTELYYPWNRTFEIGMFANSTAAT